MFQPPQILFENEHLILVDKPSGYLSVPSRMGISDPRPVVGIQLQNYVGTPIFPVHRLDEETSGLLLFAKTKPAQKILSGAFEQHQVQKTYQALSELQAGAQNCLHLTFKNKLVRGKKRSFEAEHGQYAETWIENIECFSTKYWLWTLQPKTGRSHQLRVQLAMRGYPLLGDKLYGGPSSLPSHLYLPPGSLVEKTIGLRAIKLDFQNKEEIDKIGINGIFSAKPWSTEV